MARNRVIYQSEALFVSPNATGSHFTCTAVVTGLGPKIGVNPATNAAGQTGNALALHTLSSPVGLQEDPLLTKGYGEAEFTVAKLASARNAGLNYGKPGVIDVLNISGAAAESIGAELKALNGWEPAGAPILNGGNTQNAARATLVANNTGQLHFFTRKSHFENAEAAYFKLGDGPTTGPAGAISAADRQKTPFCAFIQPWSGDYENLVQQIHRVQSANYSFTINRTDVNTFGQLARIDAIALEPPTVNLDFTYYPTDGFNERNLGFYVQGEDGLGAQMGAAARNTAAGHMGSDNAGKNFFILTTPESTDAFNSTDSISERSVIGLGNGFLSDYTIEASVGSIPTANSTIELYNAKSDIGTTGVSIPGVNLVNGLASTGANFSLGHPESLRGDFKGASPSTGEFGGSSITALRPGDIQLELPAELSMFSKVSGDGAVHIQNFSLSMPLSRSPIDRLGTRFAFSRVVDLPVTASLSVSALMSDIGTGNLADLLDDCKEHDVKIKMFGLTSCNPGDEKVQALTVDFKGARIDSESMSSDIGSNKSVDLTFTTQIGGPEDLLHGVFISGANRNIIPTYADIPNR